jgi:hypothetical protein
MVIESVVDEFIVFLKGRVIFKLSFLMSTINSSTVDYKTINALV